ncbi:MAG: acyltransferase family protein [Clostridiales bacterium]|nr:acyltransferase family protein [Clostridiales bacterium]
MAGKGIVMFAEGREHHIEYDILRIVSILFVIYNHTCEDGYFFFTQFYDTNTTRVISLWFYGTMIPSILCKISVPVFFMISGALLLGREESFVLIWKKRISRYIIVLLAVSVLYFINDFLSSGNESDIMSFFILLYTNGISRHLWFLYSYIGFLIVLPFVRYIAHNITRTGVYYLLFLSIIINGVIPIAQFCLTKNEIILAPDLSFEILGLTFLYPLLGYGFTKYSPSKKMIITLSVLSVLSVVPVMILTIIQLEGIEIINMSQEEAVVGFWSCFEELRALTFFVLIKYAVNRRNVGNASKEILKEIGSCVFGIYLLGDLIKNITLFKLVLIVLKAGLPDYFAVWVLVFIVFLTALGLVYLIRKIPLVRKFL